MDISFIFTIYNRSEEVKEVIDSLKECSCLSKYQYEIVICNDGSTDSTKDLVHKSSQEFENIVALDCQSNRGRGYAVRYSASFCKGSKIFYLDSDFFKTSSSQSICDAIGILDNIDCINGNRYYEKKLLKRRKYRNILSNGYQFLSYICFPPLRSIRDTEVGFKGFKRDVLIKILSLSKENRWGFDSEILLLASMNKFDIAEVGIDWNECYDNYKTTVCLFRDIADQLRFLLLMCFRYYFNRKSMVLN